MDAAAIDQIHLNFNPQGLLVINAAVGLMMLGVALEMKISDFKRIIVSPKAPLIGLLAQFVLLPAFTYLLVLVLKPAPSIALGMMMVAACPGGNLSNIVTFSEAQGGDLDAVDAAYQGKYGRRYASIVRDLCRPVPRAATLQVHLA